MILCLSAGFLPAVRDCATRRNGDRHLPLLFANSPFLAGTCLGIGSSGDCDAGPPLGRIAHQTANPCGWNIAFAGCNVRRCADGVDRSQVSPGSHLSRAVDSRADGRRTLAASVQENPGVAAAVAWIDERIDIENELGNALASIFATAGAFVQGSLWVGTQLLITLFVLFFLLRDRHPALTALRNLLPLSDDEADMLLKRTSDTIRATVFGNVVVAIVQGALGGLMFWLLGLPAALLWGVVMAVLALIPVLGAFVVWVPAAIFLAVEGSWGKALLLTGWGTLVVGTIDNLLYPVLVGNKLRLHTVPVFFAIVGGLIVFGAAGVILGPVILAVTLGLVDVWKRRTRAGHVAEEAVATA